MYHPLYSKKLRVLSQLYRWRRANLNFSQSCFGVQTEGRKERGKVEAPILVGKTVFKKKRDEFAKELYAEYNALIFDSKLPIDICIVWNKRLLKTAGVTKLSSTYEGERSARIEISLKVVDEEIKLKTTLLHEMCHVAAWVLSEERYPGHGPQFYFWGNIVENLTGFEVSVRHNFEIHKPHHFECTGCGAMFGRHSKRGIDVAKKICGKCRSQIVYVGRFNRDGSRVKTAKLNSFASFVKENFATVMSSKHKSKNNYSAMKELSKLYRDRDKL